MAIDKAFFRYLRGELLNGYYIRKLNLITNKLESILSLKIEILYWLNAQFTLKQEINSLKDKDLTGIAQVAGVLSVRGITDFMAGWIRLSESRIVNAKERSERGLFNQDEGVLEYVRTEQDTYPTDIATIATDSLRMSLIPDGTLPIGYVWGDSAAVLLDTGKVNEYLLHATPPEGYEPDPVTSKWIWPHDDYEAYPPPMYAPWYGDQFMPLTTTYFSLVNLPDNLLAFLLSAQQMIKYSGLGLVYLLSATTEIIPDLIKDLKIELKENYASEDNRTWYYKLTFTKIDENFAANNGWIRYAAWAYFIQSKYPFIQFNNTGE